MDTQIIPENIIARLKWIKTLEDGWDSGMDGPGKKFNQSVIDSGYSFVRMLLSKGIDDPNIAPDVDGSIHISFKLGNSFCNVTIDEHGY